MTVSFNANGTEAFNYDRAARFEGVWLERYEDTDGDPSTLELVKESLLDAVFAGEGWTDRYISLTGDGNSFEPAAAENSGLNDFAQAVEDARAVINYIHDTGAVLTSAPADTSTSVEPAALFGTALSLEAQPTASAEDGHDDATSELILGTNQSDTVEGGGGSQTFLSDNGSDQVSAGGGKDTVDGGNAEDSILGNGGPDQLAGSNGDDWLEGGAGPDVLDGGNGDDVLIGGIAPDMLTGGRGADLFVYLARTDAPAHGKDGGDEGGGDGDGGHETGDAPLASSASESTEERQETITDFKPGVDKIDFSQLDAELHFSDIPDAYAVWVEPTDEGALVQVDLDGNLEGTNPAEMSIVLAGVQAQDLGGADFLL